MKPVIIIVIAFVLLIPVSSFAQSQGVSITTMAEQGSKIITVTGKGGTDTTAIIFTIKTPSNEKIVAVEMAWLDNNNEFEIKFNVDSLWDEDGFYKILADTDNPLYDLEINVEVIDGLVSKTNITESSLEMDLSTTTTVFSEKSLDEKIILQPKSDYCTSEEFLYGLSFPVEEIIIQYKAATGISYREYASNQGFEDYLKEIDYKNSERATNYVNSILNSS